MKTTLAPSLLALLLLPGVSACREEMTDPLPSPEKGYLTYT